MMMSPMLENFKSDLTSCSRSSIIVAHNHPPPCLESVIPDNNEVADSNITRSTVALAQSPGPILIPFEPKDLLSSPVTFSLPEQHWISILSTPCSFAPPYFLQVMDNLLRNPNITSTSLFRAEIYYDSTSDIHSFDDPGSATQNSALVKSMREGDRPRKIGLANRLRLKRTVVRKLVPRNTALDKPLVQTVHFLGDEEEKENVIVQIPHVDSPGEVPFYHPKVQALAIRHTHQKSEGRGDLSLHYQLFPDSEMTDRMQRTALNLLRIIHKHSNGKQNGYQKRVQLDQIIPQKRFQDTYSKLKTKHAKWLMDAWAEVTDPLKHVFEDLGIAAFLIELWKDMYGSKLAHKKNFPGFVDVGCGNGVLVYILLMEGYKGWGFDARRRKSWAVFPESVQQKLKEMILVPDVLLKENNGENVDESFEKPGENGGIHNGIFPSGTFIISNHADQLTPWTPLLAYASQSPFIAIPCCSHSLSGKVHRYYDTPPSSRSSGSTDSTRQSEESSSTLSSVDELSKETSSSTQSQSPSSSSITSSPNSSSQTSSSLSQPVHTNPQKGPLTPRPKQPSAYAGFTAHIMHLASSIGFQNINSEILRIPSTRNLCVVGTTPRMELDQEKRWCEVREILEAEVNDMRKAAEEWIQGAKALRKPGITRGGH